MEYPLTCTTIQFSIYVETLTILYIISEETVEQ